MLKKLHNPDILTCLANLSSDEVFTPPKLANQMLDSLPKEIWQDETVTFLDPVSKSGVFLREITKRLLDGLESKIPDLETRINHILKKQVYGIGITELTALISRRTLYCSKYANGKYSIVHFEDKEGNVRYFESQHTWVDDKICKYCGVRKGIYQREKGLESYAYSFIHGDKPEELFNMKFDVVVGNPPYQLDDGGNNASATPIYNLFVGKAKKLNPKFLLMIIPARWYAGGRGLNQFRTNMLTDNHLKEIHDYKNASECFPGIRVGGGICYFLWERGYSSNQVKVIEYENHKISNVQTRKALEDDMGVFIRNSMVHSILIKIKERGVESMQSIVFPQKPYGFRTDFIDFDKDGDIKIYTKKVPKGYACVHKKKITKNLDRINEWKVVTSRSTSVPEEDNGQVLRLSQTFIAEPNSVVTESYVVVGSFKTELEAKNCLSYLKTKFVRLLCQINIVSPDVSPRVFSLVPLQDFSKKFDDKKLSKKYNLSNEQILYTASLIKEAE